MVHNYLRARHILSSASSSLRAPFGATSRPRSQTPFGAQRRHASTSAGTDSLLLARLKAFVLTTALGASIYATYLYTTDTRAAVHRHVIPRLLRLVYPDAEDAHHAGTAALKNLHALGLHPRERTSETTNAGLSVTVLGTVLQNPIGISAGLDKDAEIPDALFALGASVVEVGGITPLPQPGSARPRVWRVPSADGLVNRYGLNSQGALAVAARLRRRVRALARDAGLGEDEVLDGRAGVPPGSLAPGRLLLVQLAKNKDTVDTDAAVDYVAAARALAPLADVLVVNVSSPNTPGLRDLQAAEPLTRILGAVVAEAKRTRRRIKPRVMVKVSPDEEADAQIEGICQAVWASGVDGVIVGNTTRKRTGLLPEGVSLGSREQRALMEMGGYSGPAMFERTLDLVGRYRKVLDAHSLGSGTSDAVGSSVDAAGIAVVPAAEGLTAGKDPPVGKGPEQKVIFATGGITNGEQALKVLNAGASVAMVYTGMVYGGAGTVTRIKGEMREHLGNGTARTRLKINVTGLCQMRLLGQA